MVRLNMLLFIFSKMLNPLSYTVFLLFFTTIYLLFMNVLPTVHSTMLSELASTVYTPLLFLRLLLFLVACTLTSVFVLNVLVVGKVIVKRMTLSVIMAFCLGHVIICFAAIGVPLELSLQQRQHALHQLFNETPIELFTTMLLGILLALYVGILSKESFKKDIGFIDDRL